jgi:hypothetical protein
MWVLIAGVGSSPAAADIGAQTDTTRPGVTVPVRPPGEPKNPYRRLFLLPGQTTPSSPPRLRASPPPANVLPPPPTVVCGTRLIPGDSNVDARIHRRPGPGGPRYTMRAVEPPMCW